MESIVINAMKFYLIVITTSKSNVLRESGIKIYNYTDKNDHA